MYPIKEAMQTIQELDIKKTLETLTVTSEKIHDNDISKIINMERPDISLAVYSLLQHSQPTTSLIKRSFSILQKLLAKEKNFKDK